MASLTGLDRLAKGGFRALKGHNFALVINPTAVDRKFRHILTLLDEAGLTPTAIFAPEHGLSAHAQDMVAVEDGSEKAKRTRVYSLYGDTFDSLTPTLEMLRGIDLVVYDIQDVGSRYYTFVATLLLCMQACAKVGIPVLVLDRPNPLGDTIEGPPIDLANYRSFVGWYAAPVRHGMTTGELAHYANDSLALGCDLTVLTVTDHERARYFDATGCPWVMPSPNMPTLDTAIVYPGGCLYEGTSLSEGRGTTRPFELVGAPFIDEEKLARALNDYRLRGVTFRPVRFMPQFQKCAKQSCGGVQFHVTDRAKFKPFLAGVAVLKAVRDLFGDAMTWRTERYEFIDTIPAIDLLAGSSFLREMIDAHASLDEIEAHYHDYAAAFRRTRKPYLLY